MMTRSQYKRRKEEADAISQQRYLQRKAYFLAEIKQESNQESKTREPTLLDKQDPIVFSQVDLEDEEDEGSEEDIDGDDSELIWCCDECVPVPRSLDPVPSDGYLLEFLCAKVGMTQDEVEKAVYRQMFLEQIQKEEEEEAQEAQEEQEKQEGRADKAKRLKRKADEGL